MINRNQKNENINNCNTSSYGLFQTSGHLQFLTQSLCCSWYDRNADMATWRLFIGQLMPGRQMQTPPTALWVLKGRLCCVRTYFDPRPSPCAHTYTQTRTHAHTRRNMEMNVQTHTAANFTHTHTVVSGQQQHCVQSCDSLLCPIMMANRGMSSKERTHTHTHR